MIIDEDEYLAHYGTPRHSGRYPWGSGEAHDQGTTRNPSFLEKDKELKRQGMSDVDICKALGIGTLDKDGNFKPSTKQLRARRTMEGAAKKQEEVATAIKLKDKGLGNTAAARKMGVNESYYRTLIAAGAADKAKALTATSDMLQKEVDNKHFVDVGSGVEIHMGIAKTRLDAALAVLKEKGYDIHEVKIPQATTRFETNFRVLVRPGVTQYDVWKNQDKIQQIGLVSTDNGRPGSWERNDHPPLVVDPKRVSVKWAEDGGGEKDGVLYVRPGVPDISLGKAKYAQVRVKVGDGHYLKGMAMYNDNLPAGTDILFHTSKPKSANKLDAMKPLKDDEKLPFGSVIKRQLQENGKVTSAMNIVNEEGDWKKWSRNISAQTLSKQSPQLAREQLSKTLKSRQVEYDEIMSLTNPAVRKKLLASFADETDRVAVHLKAAALDRQNWHTILPIETMKPTEIYAPKYNNGEKVALIRYPHGGTFEIPILTVNNRHPEARSLIEGAQDAVGIHHSVAQHLSGADFDGDTVLVIPNDNNVIKATHALDELKTFDPKRLYKLPEGQSYSKDIAGEHALKMDTQMEMGKISNLITDMTLQNAPTSEIAQAVKHSMVVIDAEKHDLDFKRSYRDQGIRALQEKYQAKEDPTKRAGGAATIISRAKSKLVIDDRKGRSYKQGEGDNRGPINTETGELEWVPSGKTRRGPNGTRIPKRITTTRLAEAKDAHDLVSTANTPMERIYADHSNALKALANKARLSLIHTPTMKISSSAKKQYEPEIRSLTAALSQAQRNSPLERQANIIANIAINERRAANPDLKHNSDTLKKIKQQEMQKARDRLGARKQQIQITDKEWHAIQAGAISHSKLEKILNNADLERVRELATPRPERMMTKDKVSRAQKYLDQGYTKAEVARRLGVSVSTLELSISGDAEDETP